MNWRLSFFQSRQKRDVVEGRDDVNADTTGRNPSGAPLLQTVEAPTRSRSDNCWLPAWNAQPEFVAIGRPRFFRMTARGDRTLLDPATQTEMPLELDANGWPKMESGPGRDGVG
jgi:hypothetical protein